MPKKNQLKALSKKVPTDPEVDSLLQGLREKDDIHLAIMGVSIIEARLEGLLLDRVRRADADFRNRLFDNRGPLSDFNSKIMVAEAFSFIESGLAEELHIMRAIRNAFAHAKMPITFEDGPVAKEVDKLKMLETILESGRVVFKTEHTNKEWFLLAVQIALLALKFRMKINADNPRGSVRARTNAD